MNGPLSTTTIASSSSIVGCTSFHPCPNISLQCGFFHSTPEMKVLIPMAKKRSASDFRIPIQKPSDPLDDLLDKHGEVVYKRSDQKLKRIEDEYDPNTLAFALALAKIAHEVKVADIKLLFVKPLIDWTNFFILATAFSRPQIDAVGKKMIELAEKKYQKSVLGDFKPNSWTLLDFDDVVVNVFLPPEREYYELDDVYGNAPRIKLPFDDMQVGLQ